MPSFLAYAKVNLGLEIIGKRSDGYHDVRTIMQEISLADRIDIEPAADLAISCDLPDLENETNLVMRAAVALRACSPDQPGARIRLEKRIPIAAGLGGGSSDAATTLVALNQLWGIGLERDALMTIARQLGADVGFFLLGGTAEARGIGDVLTPLPTPNLWLTIGVARPGIPDKTRRLYAALEPEDLSSGEAVAEIAAAIRAGEPLQSSVLPSSFARVARSLIPEIGAIASSFSHMGATANLCGAGPAVIGLFAHADEALRVRDGLSAADIEAYTVRTVTRSERAGMP